MPSAPATFPCIYTAFIALVDRPPKQVTIYMHTATMNIFMKIINTGNWTKLIMYMYE